MLSQISHRQPLSVTDYSVHFWTLAADAQWIEAALKAVFLKGLSEQLKDELAARDLPSFVALAINIDNRLLERQW